MSASMNLKSGEKIPQKCLFFIKRKNRNCKFQTSKDSDYCVEHLAQLTNDNSYSGGESRRRIPCPHDPKHSVFEHKLEKHLKKCNVVKLERSLEAQKGFSRNINSPDPYEDDKSTYSQVTMRSAPKEEVLSLIEKVQVFYEEHRVEIDDEVLSHNALKKEMNTPGYGPAVLKHLKQLSSLLGQMEKMQMLHGDTCYVEFGAGKGQLSHWVQRALPDEKDIEFLLIDRAGNRHKLDGKNRDDGGCINSHRLKMDIEHLDLGRVPCIKNLEKPIVGMSKHLCGAATDLCLRCVVNTLKFPSPDPKEVKEREPKIPRLMTDTPKRSHLRGVVIALCCHHKGNWHQYCGKEFFRQCGLTARDFHIIQSLGGWAVCGVRKDDTKAPENSEEQESASEKPEEKGHETNVESLTGQGKESTLERSNVKDKGTELKDKDEIPARFEQFNHEEKEEIGRQCKRLIDIGRIKYLESCGYNAVLKKYISKDLTLENIALIVTPAEGQDT